MTSDNYSLTQSGKRAKLTIKSNYAFFWGQWPSNWEYSPFTLNGEKYTCVEQWMMAEKARIFNDNRARNLILKTPSPAEQKQLGRKVKNYDEEIWSSIRYNVVLTGTLEKYRQNNWLCDLLLDTGDLLFVEASPEDPIWGIGMKSSDPNILNTKLWGQNLLGKIITEAREIIKQEKQK